MEVISLLLPCGDQASNSLVMKSGFLVLKHTLRPPPPAPLTHTPACPSLRAQDSCVQGSPLYLLRLKRGPKEGGGL